MSTVAGAVATAEPHSPHRAFRIWIALLALGIALGFGAWVYQLSQGLAATNMRNPMMWGLYITLFMYFVGLSAGGLTAPGTCFATRT
jgi:Ni/Fe-hydrogenase subunit HybB-like protein